MISPTLTSQGSTHVQNRLARLVTKSPPFIRILPLLRSLHCLPVNFRILFKISLLTYKTLRGKQPVYHHPMLAASLPSCSLRSKELVRRSLGLRWTQVQELFTLEPNLTGTTSRCLFIQPFQLLPLRNIRRHISLAWPFPHRHLYVRWPIDVTDVFLRFCSWTTIRLLCHWAWLCWGFWRYRNLIDWWLIGW